MNNYDVRYPGPLGGLRVGPHTLPKGEVVSVPEEVGESLLPWGIEVLGETALSEEDADSGDTLDGEPTKEEE